MKAFVSHNKADKELAQAMAEALVSVGVRAWLDAWSIKPGESIIEGIEFGIGSSELLILLWSREAAKSNWVGMEWRSFITRRVKDGTLKVIPLMLDDAPLPSLVAEYRGFPFSQKAHALKIAYEIIGHQDDAIVRNLLHNALLEKLRVDKPMESRPIALFCERCQGVSLKRGTYQESTGASQVTVYYAKCTECGYTVECD